MKIAHTSFGKIFSPRILSRAIQTFDRATMVIVSVCWGGAVLLMLFALYTVHLSVEAKTKATQAAAMEPSLPRMNTRPIEAVEMKPVVERLQKRFSDITFVLSNDMSLAVSAVEGSKFRAWLTVLSYIDTIIPQYRWQIKEFCVGGRCPGNAPMRAVLQAEKISFAAPNLKVE